MKNQQKIFTFLLLVVFVVGLTAQCPGQFKLKGVQHGMFELADLSGTDPSAHTDVIAFKQYSVTTKNTLKDPKILVALSNISALTSTIDLFDINIISRTETQFVLGFIYEPQKWNKISYRYLISDRSEMNFRMITLSSVSFKSTDNKNIVAETELDQPLSNFDKFQVLSFIRGLKYKNNQLVDHSLVVAILSTKLTEKSIVLNVSAVTNSTKVELQLLSVSYLYFEAKPTKIESFGGLISRSNFVGKSQIDILYADLPTDLYWLYGITNLDINGKKFDITSEITQDSFFSLETTISAKKIEFTYFSVGAKASQVCLNCAQKIISDSNCVKDCQINEIYYDFLDGTKACVKCEGSLVSDLERKSCVQAGTAQALKLTNVSNQVSTPIPLNQSKSSSISQAPQTISQSLISTLTSAPLATDVVKNSSAQQAPSKKEPVLNQRLTSNLSAYQVQQFNYCNNMKNSYWTGESCQCKVGFKISSGSCVSIVSTEENVIVNPVVSTATVDPVSQLLPNRSKNHLHKDLNSSNSIFDTLLPKPGSTSCPSQNQVFNNKTLQCECKEGLGFKMNLVEDSFNCVNCSEFYGYYLESGHCLFCGENQLYDQVKNKCSCADGFSYDSLKNCVPIPSIPQTVGEKKVQPMVKAQIKLEDKQKNTVKTTPSSQSTDTTKNLTSSATPYVNAAFQNLSSSLTNIPAPKVSETSNKQTIKNMTGEQSSKAQTLTQTTLAPSQTSNTSINLVSAPVSAPASASPVIATSPTPTPNPISSDIPVSPPKQCMKLMKTPQVNAANVFITLELLAEKTFRSEDEMQSFLKQEFLSDFSKPSSVYCNQNDSSLKEFDCLLLYPTGVPNQNFDINFWFNDSASNTKCTLKVPVNPLESAAKSLRSLRRRSN